MGIRLQRLPLERFCSMSRCSRAGTFGAMESMSFRVMATRSVSLVTLGGMVVVYVAREFPPGRTGQGLQHVWSNTEHSSEQRDSPMMQSVSSCWRGPSQDGRRHSMPSLMYL